jgi:tRNA pseudouridine55 synthase
VSQQEAPKGEIILIDKPLGWTSFQAVKKVKWLIKAKKVGHAGTLDPLATGLLILCTEKKTKEIESIQAQEKEYTGTITLGATTPSYDLETEPNVFFPTSHITLELVQATLSQFIGEISQIPPLFSAIKVDGKRAYTMARSGSDHELKPRTIHIREFEITRFEMPEIDFRVCCSKGTYIRSLAFDFGKAIGSGGYLSALRRTKIGPYSVENAVEPQNVPPTIVD